jgi:hypothetical protein
VIAIQLWDPRESEIPPSGLVALQDPETGRRVVVDASSAAVRRSLHAATLVEAGSIFRKARVDAVALSTSESYERPLAAFFDAREKRRR